MGVTLVAAAGLGLVAHLVAARASAPAVAAADAPPVETARMTR